MITLIRRRFLPLGRTSPALSFSFSLPTDLLLSAHVCSEPGSAGFSLSFSLFLPDGVVAIAAAASDATTSRRRLDALACLASY